MGRSGPGGHLMLTLIGVLIAFGTLLPNSASHRPISTPAPATAVTAQSSPTPFQKSAYKDYSASFLMFASGTWNGIAEKAEVYGLIDTIEGDGKRAKIWLIIDDAAWTTGYEVRFEQSLFDTDVTYGDILHMYCTAMEPRKVENQWKQKVLIRRAKCDYFERLSKEEAERRYKAIVDFFD